MSLMKTPRALDIEITNKCNLRCAYCCHFTSAGDVKKDLPADEWLTFFEELDRCSVMRVTLEGGEPFARKDLPEIVDGIVRNRMRFSILSNGTLITDDMAARLAATKRCESIQVSVDGSRPSVHDMCRGEGSFEKAVEGIRILREHGINVTVRVTIHKGNVRDLENIAKFLLVDLGLPGFSTNEASFMGLCRTNSDRVQLDVEEKMLAMSTLIRINREYGGRVSGLAGPVADARLWGEMEKARREGLDRLPGRGFLTACNSSSNKLGVRADGVIVPCTQLSHIELGRINRDDLLELWANHPELTRMRNRPSIPLSDFGFCRDCPYMHYCTGNCPALAFNRTGRTDSPASDSCLKLFLAQGGRIPETQDVMQ